MRVFALRRLDFLKWKEEGNRLAGTIEKMLEAPEKIIASRFDAAKHPPYLTMALGAGSVTPWQMARAYGVEAFCYYHYWFGGGKRALERPFAEVLASGRPDFPFCLCWANESWTRAWDGRSDEVLIAQELRQNSKWIISGGGTMPVIDLREADRLVVRTKPGAVTEYKASFTPGGKDL